MKGQNQIIGGRYQYTPANPLRQTAAITEYKAYDRVTKRDLLLHILPEDDRLLQVFRDIKHPFLVLVFDAVMLENGNVAFLYENGAVCSLADIMHNNGWLLQEDALVIVKILLLGLKELHDKLITFGRICPQNALLWNFSLIKLGYTIYPEEIPLRYQSPQVLEGKESTSASDIYSLGVILYELIYGVVPFEGNTTLQLVKKIKGRKFNKVYENGHSPFNLVITKEVSVLVQSMLGYVADKRPSADQILAHTNMNFNVETEQQAYTKPKTNILPEPFIKRYLVYRASKMQHRYDGYYQQSSYMALSTADKKMVRIYIPEVRMFEAEPRKIESYFEKIRAIKQNYGEDCEFLVKVEDIDKFRQEPVLVTQYCNQGDLLTYLQRRKDAQGWLKQKEVSLLIYIVALAIRQIRELGVTSVHTLHTQRVMVSDKGIKLREPGIITPVMEKRLQQGRGVIDYFAPELKQNSEMTELDKSDMWSLGILYYYLLSQKLPVANEDGLIDIEGLRTNQKNRNIIGKCLDYSVDTRLELQKVKLDGVDQDLLGLMIREKQEHDEEMKEKQRIIEDDDVSLDEDFIAKDRRIMFRNRKKPVFKDYNKILAQSSTSQCRICIKILLGIIVIFFLFFGRFLINGGYGLIRSYYFNPITLQVPYNYGTSLVDMTILTTNGAYIQQNYSQYSYQQFTQVLRCVTNQYTTDAPGKVADFINGSNTAFCLYGYFWVIAYLIMYTLQQMRLDLPTILWERKDKKEDRKLWHLVMFLFLLPAVLFCFFYTFVIEYIMQISPCFGLQNHAYPTFTSVQTLLNGDTGGFFTQVFLTVILWAMLMIFFGFISLLVKKVNIRVNQWKVIIGFSIVMVVFTLICRVGFGSSTPLQPTWSYKINTDLAVEQYYGFFGFFPEALTIPLFLIDRLIDFIFWYFLKRGLEGTGQEDIRQVKVIQAKYEPTDEKGQLDGQKSNIYLIEHDFERFD